MTSTLFSSAAVQGIGLYQSYVSPYKGFNCAHRVSAGKWSCSQFGKRVFARFDVATAYALLQRRFAACRASYQAIKAVHMSSKTDDEDTRRKSASKSKNSGVDCNPIDAADLGACDCSL